MNKYLITKDELGTLVVRVGKINKYQYGGGLGKNICCEDLHIILSTSNTIIINEQKNAWRPAYMSSNTFNKATTADSDHIYDFETDEAALLFAEVKDYD